MKGCAGVVVAAAAVCVYALWGEGKTARCFNEAFVLVYSRCACADGLLWLCVTALPLSLPLSAGRLNIDKTQTDPNVSSNRLTLPKTQNSGL